MRRWLDTRICFNLSPLVGNILSREVRDNLVKVWSVSARKEVASLAGHTNDVCWSVAFSPDGQHRLSLEMETTNERCGREWNFVVYYIPRYFYFR